MEELFSRYPNRIADMMEQLRLTAESLHLPFGERTMTFNSRLAQELGLWAQDKAQDSQFHDAAFKSYFVDGDNIAKKEALLAIVRHVGLDEKEAEGVIDSRSYSDAVDRDWHYSYELGITAVPTFVINKDKLVGAQDYRSLAQFVTENGGRKR